MNNSSRFGVDSRKQATGAALFFVLIMVAGLELACGSGGVKQVTAPAGAPTFDHVVLVVEENHSYSDVIGTSAMPYLNSLASKYGLATAYFANGHPSMPNYLMLTTGQIESSSDAFTGTIDDNNVVRALVKAGKSWKAYLESIPSKGYLGGDAPPYVRRHNPFSLLSDVQKDPSQAANMVPFTQFASDVANNSLPQYSFVAPNVNNDAHNGTLAAADSWLQSNIAPLIASSSFQSSGLLIITFDESETTDVDHGGGHVATLIISSKSKSNYQSSTVYQHQSILRLILVSSGLATPYPGQAGNAPDMTEFFTGH